MTACRADSAKARKTSLGGANRACQKFFRQVFPLRELGGPGREAGGILLGLCFKFADSRFSFLLIISKGRQALLAKN